MSEYTEMQRKAMECSGRVDADDTTWVARDPRHQGACDEFAKISKQISEARKTQNTIIIRGLQVDPSKPEEGVAQFLKEQFNVQQRSFTDFQRLNEPGSNGVYMVELKYWSTKRDIFLEKKKLARDPAFRNVRIDNHPLYVKRLQNSTIFG